MAEPVDLLVHDLPLLLTMAPKPGEDPLGALRDVAVAFQDGRVAWIGPRREAPSARARIDGAGQVGLPGLVEPHTHAIWAGSRAEEHRLRLAGVHYSEILERGGGILSTVRATRAASDEELRHGLRARLARLLAAGVTTVEVKSGYGLDPDHEERLLRLAGEPGPGPRVLRTFLGAHAIPAEHRARREAYVRQIVEEQLPRCAPHCEAIDVYCDRGAFTLDEAVEILRAGQRHGLRLRAHAEQVEHTGIAAAAAALGALAVDHLERLDEAGVEALARHGTIAVLLPGAQLYLRDTAPPVAALREAGVRMALGTDLNPGSSPVYDPWTCATLGCLLQGLSVEEALLGITRNAALALGEPTLGRLVEGGPGDLVLVRPPPGEPPSAAALLQSIGGARPAAVVHRGRLLDSGIY